MKLEMRFQKMRPKVSRRLSQRLLQLSILSVALLSLLNANLYAQTRSAQTEAQRKALAYFEKGMESAGQEYHNNAIALFNLSLKFDNRNWNAYYNLGVSQQSLGDFARAIRNYSYALELTTGLERAKIFSARGTAFAADEKYDKAIQDYNRALKLAPENAVIYSNRGMSFSAMANNQAALLDFTTALVLHPGYASAYSGRGIVHYHMGNLAAALADYGAALEINEEDVATLYNRTLVYRDMGDYGRAIDDLNRVLDLIGRKPYLVQVPNSLEAFRKKCELALRDFKRRQEAEGRYVSNSPPEQSVVPEYDSGAPSPEDLPQPAIPTNDNADSPFGIGDVGNPFGDTGEDPFADTGEESLF